MTFAIRHAADGCGHCPAESALQQALDPTATKRPKGESSTAAMTKDKREGDDMDSYTKRRRGKEERKEKQSELREERRGDEKCIVSVPLCSHHLV